MTKYIGFSFIAIFLCFSNLKLFGQFRLPFGNVSTADLSNKPYKPDPGADAIILSKTGMASIQYQDGLFVEYEENVRIRIVNSNGYNYANVEIPFFNDDNIDYYKASTYNLRNGEKTETQIPKKSFILEKTSPTINKLKFSFLDVHEGSVVEFSFKARLRSYAINRLVRWEFQAEIPVVSSTLTVAYPDAFVYKSIITGSAKEVETSLTTANTNFFGESVTESIRTWSANNVPAFRTEPYIISKKEHLTKVSFELARVDFPKITYANISPTYQKLNEKLLDRDDFGTPLGTNLKSQAGAITSGVSDDLSKLKKIREYISNNIFWDGNYGVTASSTLRTVLRKEKGNSADINMILIAMLRSVGLKADPVLLSTRSYGSLNQNSAILQQFNYLLAAVTVGDKLFLVDATDPLLPFNLLPFDCLNNAGRLISLTESRFVDLKNNVSGTDFYEYNMTIDIKGNVSGNLKQSLSDYSAYSARRLVKLEGEQGYQDIFRSLYPNATLSDVKISNLKDPDSELILTSELNINDGAQIGGEKIIFNLLFSLGSAKNEFYSKERKYPVDFGHPISEKSTYKLRIPDGYTVAEKPSDISLSLGPDGGKFDFSSTVNDNEIAITSNLNITKTVFLPSEYPLLRSFYEKILQKEAEVIILKKNPVIK